MTIEESRIMRNVLEGSKTCQMDEMMKNISTKTAPNERRPPITSEDGICRYHTCDAKRELFIDNLLVRIH